MTRRASQLRCRPHRHGIMLTDAVFGLLVVAATAVLLATTTARHREAGERLAASRTATRVAEQVLTDLQLGQSPPAEIAGARYEVKPIESVAPGGQRWVEVRVTFRNRSASLTGLVPAGATAGGAP